MSAGGSEAQPDMVAAVDADLVAAGDPTISAAVMHCMRVLEHLPMGAAVEVQAFLLWGLAENCVRIWPGAAPEEAVGRALDAVHVRAIQLAGAKAARAGCAPFNVKLQ